MMKERIPQPRKSEHFLIAEYSSSILSSLVMSYKFGIYGFGRMGRLFLRLLSERFGRETVVVVIDISEVGKDSGLFSTLQTFLEFFNTPNIFCSFLQFTKLYFSFLGNFFLKVKLQTLEKLMYLSHILIMPGKR